MDRREELLKIIDNDTRLTVLVDEIIFLEEQLEALQKLPFIRINPKDPSIQKATAASRQYTQLSAQYNSAIRTLVSVSGGNDENDKESPLREWVKSRRVDSEQNNLDT